MKVRSAVHGRNQVVEESAPGEREAASQAMEHELSVLFSKARGFQLALARQVHPELDSASYALLLRLVDAAPVRAADIAELISQDKSTVSRQVAKLKKLGLIERAIDPGDGRARLVRLTEIGRDKLHAIQQRRRQNMRHRFDGWTVDELLECSRTLGRLNDKL
jgi:DNA-binding MarR family transcriptional regulator